jgi:hypothetical protein
VVWVIDYQHKDLAKSLKIFGVLTIMQCIGGNYSKRMHGADSRGRWFAGTDVLARKKRASGITASSQHTQQQHCDSRYVSQPCLSASTPATSTMRLVFVITHCCCRLLLLPSHACRSAPSQMHNIEDVAWVSIFGTVGMLLAMVVVVGKLIAIYATSPPAAPTELVATGQGLNVSQLQCERQGMASRFLSSLHAELPALRAW